jgi:2-polyprenyl-6-methoxyphenol hydroxylase-like FAD-dependent oxidoreductase
MPSWSTRRVTLVGDAGYCASPLSGMGTSLALVGAYVLAGELGPAPTRNADDIATLDAGGSSAALGAEQIAAALGRYETRMRPYVDRCQSLQNSIDRYAPMRESDIAATAAVMKWAQRWPFRPLAARAWFSTADSMALPDYA